MLICEWYNWGMKKDKIDLELSYGLCHTGNKKRRICFTQ